MSSNARRLRVLVVSHACVVDANQTLYQWIPPDVEIKLVVPRQWRSELVGRQPAQRLPSLDDRITTLDAMFSGRGSLHFYRGAAGVVAAFKPDLVFLDEEPWSLCALQFTRLARRFGARTMFYTKENLRRSFPAPFSWIEQYVFRNAASAAVISLEAAEVLRSKGYRGPTVVLPHGFEPEWFRPRSGTEQRRALGLASFVIGYFGRLAPEKGVSDLLAAVRSITADNPDAELSVLIIGSGPQEQELEDAAARTGLGGRVRFLPAVAHNKIAAYYNCIDVLVVPSRTTPQWKEQFGRVLIEGMASGVCVIGSNSGEIPNVIGDAGLVYDEGDIDALGKALQRVIADVSLRQQLSARARQRAGALYSNPAIAAQAAECWRQAATN